MTISGNKVVCDCGYVNVIAGLHQRPYGHRASERGTPAAVGAENWGEIICIQCGKTLIVPSAPKEK